MALAAWGCEANGQNICQFAVDLVEARLSGESTAKLLRSLWDVREYQTLKEIGNSPDLKEHDHRGPIRFLISLLVKLASMPEATRNAVDERLRAA